MKIVALTTACVDVFEQTKEILPGGEALNFITNCSQYEEVESYFIGAVGNDSYGEIILGQMKQTRVHLEGLHIKEGITANNRIYINEKGDRYFHEDSWSGGVYETFQLSENDKELILAADAVHTTSFCPNLLEIMALKHEGHYKLSVDFNIRRDFEQMLPLIPQIDFFFISGDSNVITSMKEWSRQYSTIFVVTLGERGSVCLLHGEETYCESMPVDRVVDTTGCGDSYQAGFVVNYMLNKEIKQAMEAGTRHASVTLGQFGGMAKC